jgi:hypothetical protein
MRRLHAATVGRLILIALCVAWAAKASLAEEAAADSPLLTVDQAVQIAIANNYSLKIASLDKQIEMADCRSQNQPPAGV